MNNIYPEYPESHAIADMLSSAKRVVIMQADNPDADSLGSALALEQIIDDLGKEPIMYCGVDVPGYLRYLQGWDRVVKDIPQQFDISIVVDASTLTLFEKLAQSGQKGWVASKPCAVLDHHGEVQNPIPFASAIINDGGCSSTGELIYRLAKQLQWPLHIEAQVGIMTAILGDTQGLSNQLTSANTYRVMADMVDAGVDRSKLEEARREASKMHPSIFGYKARLIDRTEHLADGRLAIVTIPQSEISQYSPLYNPGPLIQPDMLQTAGVLISIVLKRYDDGKVTVAIRCNHGAGVASQLAEHFGGGGHAFAAGFKTVNNKPFDEIKAACIAYAIQLLDSLDSEITETVEADAVDGTQANTTT